MQMKRMESGKCRHKSVTTRRRQSDETGGKGYKLKRYKRGAIRKSRMKNGEKEKQNPEANTQKKQ